MAAVLAGGLDAVLSHRSAADALGIRRSARRRVEITIGNRRCRARSDIEPHVGELPLDEITTVCGIPVTTVPRTILDLATVLPRREVERAVHEAEVARLTDALSLEDLVARYPRRRGGGTVRAILASGRIGSLVTRSELEERFLAFLRRCRLPLPRFNLPLEIGGRWIEADCVWVDTQVIVELDGRATHGDIDAFECDRERDRALQAAGWRVIRVTWRHVHRHGEGLERDLRAILSRPVATAATPGGGR